jgi:hypothetical protein
MFRSDHPCTQSCQQQVGIESGKAGCAEVPGRLVGGVAVLRGFARWPSLSRHAAVAIGAGCGSRTINAKGITPGLPMLGADPSVRDQLGTPWRATCERRPGVAPACDACGKPRSRSRGRRRSDSRKRNTRLQPTQTSTEHQRLLCVIYRCGDRVSAAVCDRRTPAPDWAGMSPAVAAVPRPRHPPTKAV